jgi:Na+/H+ antiporter NhaD/arsenite permease-like protein
MSAGVQPFLAGAIFLGAYALIATEKAHRTVVALAGAALMLITGLVSQRDAFCAGRSGVDWNTVFLLFGMMVMVGITKQTGAFQWLAIKSAKAARADPMRLLVMLSAVTALLSAFLDNVTTVLLIAPATMLIAEALSVSAVPFLICEILASNIGGTATLIGDPPNIMIASASGLGFNSFLLHLAPVVVIIFLAYLATVRWFFRRSLSVADNAMQRLQQFDERRAITNPWLLRRCVAVLGLTLAGFFLHEPLHLMPATVALAGAALLLVVSRVKIDEVLHEVEWPTLLFFVGLFVMVAGLIHGGIIAAVSRRLLALAGRSTGLTAMALLWGSAAASAVVDNIPFVAAVNPMLVEVGRSLAAPSAGLDAALRSPQMMPLWWSLALGACLGGNGTLIGASANVVVAGLAERNGNPIRFGDYLKYGLPLMIESVAISSAYVYLRYLV